MKNTNFSMLGLLQAVAVVFYCVLVAGFFWSANKLFVAAGQFEVTALMLIILVFSAAVTGSLVFGYPAYLALNKKLKEALTLVAYTLLYLLGLLIVTGVLVLTSR